jgi:predicted ATPase
MPTHADTLLRTVEAHVDTRVPFVGRAAEVDRLLAFLERGDAATLIGPGGVGKSRLAFEATRRFSSRTGRPVVFVELAAVPPESVLGAVMAAATEREQAGEDTIERLRRRLRERAAIVVFDNCEHAPDETSAIVDALRAESSISLIATSQRRLDYTDETVIEIDPFRIDDGIRFFMARAQIDPQSAGDEAASDIATIVRRLDGLAVALDLAAARLASLSLAELAAELESLRPYHLRSTRGSDPRHRTIGNVIAWSHSHLNDVEKRVFALCSTFSDSFDGADLAALLGESETGAAANALEELAESSLIVRRAERYRMLSPIRAVAMRLLSQSADRRTIDERFAAYMNQFAVRIRSRIESGTSGESAVREWVSRYGDCCTALGWALKRPAQRMPAVIDVATTLSFIWADGGRFTEGLRWTERFEAVAPRLSPEFRGKLQYLTLRVAYAACEYERMLQAGPSAVSAFTIAGDRLGLARAYNGMAVASLYTGRYDQAETCVHTAIALYRALGHERGLGSALTNEGNIALEGRSDALTARKLYRESLEILTRTGPDSLVGITHGNLAEAEFHLRNYDASERAARSAIGYFERSQSVTMLAWQEQVLAGIEIARGNNDAAHVHLRNATELLWRSPQPLYLALTAESIARLLLREGCFADAVIALEMAKRIRRERHLPPTGPGAAQIREDTAKIEARLDSKHFEAAARRLCECDPSRYPEVLSALLPTPTMVGAERGEDLV